MISVVYWWVEQVWRMLASWSSSVGGGAVALDMGDRVLECWGRKGKKELIWLWMYDRADQMVMVRTSGRMKMMALDVDVDDCFADESFW